MREPDFRRVALAVEFGCFNGPQWHPAAEHCDCPGFFERVFDHQPTAHSKKEDEHENYTCATSGKKDAQENGAPPRNRGRIFCVCH